ncbi:MAG: sensor histidine kinase, partial [Nitrososphaeraceae archaeon]
VSIKDTGEGIDDDIIPLLFTKFATKSQQGTGLGLYISKSIIEAHGGRIWAHNNHDMLDNGEKRGATFSFTLPLTTDKAVYYDDLVKKQMRSSVNLHRNKNYSIAILTTNWWNSKRRGKVYILMILKYHVAYVSPF